MRRIIFFLLAGLVLLVSCKKSIPEPSAPSPTPSAVITPTETPLPTPSPSPSANNLSVEESYVRDSYDHADGQRLCTLNVAMPKIVGDSDAAAVVTDYYQSADLMLLSMWDEYVAEAHDRYESSKTSGNLFMPVNIEGNFSVEGYTDQFLSVKRELHIYSGGAHAGTTLYTDTFDLTTGRALSLLDFFTVAPDELQRRLLPYVTDAIQKHPDDYFENYETLARDLFPYNAYTLNENTLTLIYPEYSLAAFTQGTLSFSIPLADLQDITNKDYLR